MLFALKAHPTPPCGIAQVSSQPEAEALKARPIVATGPNRSAQLESQPFAIASSKIERLKKL